MWRKTWGAVDKNINEHEQKTNSLTKQPKTWFEGNIADMSFIKLQHINVKLSRRLVTEDLIKCFNGFSCSWTSNVQTICTVPVM